MGRLSILETPLSGLQEIRLSYKTKEASTLSSYSSGAVTLLEHSAT